MCGFSRNRHHQAHLRVVLVRLLRSLIGSSLFADVATEQRIVSKQSCRRSARLCRESGENCLASGPHVLHWTIDGPFERRWMKRVQDWGAWMRTRTEGAHPVPPLFCQVSTVGGCVSLVYMCQLHGEYTHARPVRLLGSALADDAGVTSGCLLCRGRRASDV